MYYCFGCGAGGNVFSFLMQLEGLSFPETVRMLAERFGVTIREEQGRGAGDGPSERERVTEINRIALDVFRHGLLKSPLGSGARTYLQQRGISGETLHSFGLGYVPEGWTHLRDYLNRKGFSDDSIAAAGLVVPGKRGRPYDRFRNRVMFPIQDVGGRVIGFGGRVMDDGTPKYLNSPETVLYHKSRSLYGLRQARTSIRKAGVAYVVEGYFDVIALHQHGVPQAVAGLGTALTQEHVRLLKGYTDRLVLVFDGDAAGIRAAERAAEIILSTGMETHVFLLPEGEDPDSFVRKHGGDAFLAAAAKAQPLFRFLISAAVQRHGRTVAGRLKALESLLPVVASLQDPVARDLYTRELADGLDLESRGVRERLAGIRGEKPRNPQPAAPSDQMHVPPSETRRLEEAITALLVSAPQLRDRFSHMDPLTHFSDPVLGRIAHAVLQGENLNLLAASDADLQRAFARLSVQEGGWNEENAEPLIRQFERIRQSSTPGLMDRIKAAEAGNDHAQLMELLSQKQQQARQAAQTGAARATRRQTR